MPLASWSMPSAAVGTTSTIRTRFVPHCARRARSCGSTRRPAGRPGSSPTTSWPGPCWSTRGSSRIRPARAEGWDPRSAGLEPTAAQQLSLTTADGEAHARLRHAHAPLFGARRMQAQYPQLLATARELLTRAGRRSATGGPGGRLHQPLPADRDLRPAGRSPGADRPGRRCLPPGARRLPGGLRRGHGPVRRARRGCARLRATRPGHRAARPVPGRSPPASCRYHLYRDDLRRAASPPTPRWASCWPACSVGNPAPRGTPRRRGHPGDAAATPARPVHPVAVHQHGDRAGRDHAAGPGAGADRHRRHQRGAGTGRRCGPGVQPATASASAPSWPSWSCARSCR